jgi:hypothetical protein
MHGPARGVRLMCTLSIYQCAMVSMERLFGLLGRMALVVDGHGKCASDECAIGVTTATALHLFWPSGVVCNRNCTHAGHFP